MEIELKKVIVFLLIEVLMLYRCLADDLYMQIIAPERDAISTALNSAVKRATFEANRRTSRPRNPLTMAGLRLNGDIEFVDSANPTPQELLDLFCDKIFTNNASLITSISYDELTSQSNSYVMNIARHLGYPVISWNPLYEGALESDDNSMVLQIAPTIYHQCEAMILLLERYNWTDFSILTTKDMGQDFIDCMEKMVEKTSIIQGYLTKPRFTNIATVVIDFEGQVDDYLTDEQEVYVKKMLQKLVKARSRVILFHVKDGDTLNIVDVAEDMGLVGPDFAWVLTSFSIGNLVGSGTKLPFGFLGIYINTTESVMVDVIKTAVGVWSGGLKSLVQKRHHRNMDFYPSFECSGVDDFIGWEDGRKLYDAMKSVTIAVESAPAVSFADNGVIEHVELSLLNVRREVIKKKQRYTLRQRHWDNVGRITPKIIGSRVEMTVETDGIVWPGKLSTPPKGKPEKRSFRVVTKEEPPYMIYLPPDPDTGKCGHHQVPCFVNGENLSGNETTNGTLDYCCTGLCVEVLQILAERMSFNFELYDVPDGNWGVRDNATGEWNGLIRELLDENADMIMTAFIINQVRSSVIDFSVPFLESGITIMVSIRKGAISPYAFLEPYDFYSWILILIFSVHATGASIFIFEWLSPSGLAQGKTSTAEHKFSLFRSFWLIWAMLFGASVTVDVPRGVSSRFLSNVWALFALVFLASYTANLAAFMITLDEYYDLSGIEDWRLKQPTKLTPHFKFATIPDSSTDINLRTNYPRMHKYMTKYNQSSVLKAKAALKNQGYVTASLIGYVMLMHVKEFGQLLIGIPSLLEKISRVNLKVASFRVSFAAEYNNHTIHAFLYDANVLEFMSGRDEKCSLLTVGRWYAMSGYGVGIRRDSPLKEEIDEVLLELQYNGDIERLQSFWQSGACHAKKDKRDKSQNKIGILNFISAFILLAVGVLLGLCLLTLEHLYFKSGRKCLKKYDKCGCCALVSLSMGKSLTFEQSVLEAIDIQRKHKCKDPICEMHLWKAKHELDMALIKIKKMQGEVDSAINTQATPGPSAASAIETTT